MPCRYEVRVVVVYEYVYRIVLRNERYPPIIATPSPVRGVKSKRKLSIQQHVLAPKKYKEEERRVVVKRESYCH